jgi:hypothetical protein
MEVVLESKHTVGYSLLLFGTVSTVALEFRMNNAASTPSNMQAK